MLDGRLDRAVGRVPCARPSMQFRLEFRRFVSEFGPKELGEQPMEPEPRALFIERAMNRFARSSAEAGPTSRSSR